MGVDGKLPVNATEQEAVPVPSALDLNTGLQTGVPPWVKVTLPVMGTLAGEATPGALGVMVAVKVTVWLTTAVVDALEMTAMAVASLLTVWVIGAALFTLLKLKSPET